jgi:septum formation protein
MLDPKIILASTSPRRRDLLAKTGLAFEVVPSDYEEDMTLDFAPSELAKHLSRGKAEAVAMNHRDAIVIGADTFAVFDGKILGKPHTVERARDMLRMLNGKTHTLITGFTVIGQGGAKSVSRVVETKVFFKQTLDEVIEEYIATGEPLERAGGYSIQENGGMLVNKVEGSYDNMVGLPIEDVLEVLKEFGVKTE